MQNSTLTDIIIEWDIQQAPIEVMLTNTAGVEITYISL